MARNGHSTAVETKDPADFYDELNPDAQLLWDEIGALGFTPEKGTAGLWFARKPGQAAKDAIGPADSLISLHSQVKATLPGEAFDDDILEEDELGDVVLEEEDLDNPEMIELEDDGAGNKYLPGAGPRVIKNLFHAIRNYDAIKLQRVELSNREATAKKDLVKTLKKYERHLEVDEEKKERFYVVGKIRGVIKTKETDVFVTDHVKDEEE